MTDEDGDEWIDLGGGNAYCPTLKHGRVAMMVKGSYVLMPVSTFEAIMEKHPTKRVVLR